MTTLAANHRLVFKTDKLEPEKTTKSAVWDGIAR